MLPIKDDEIRRWRVEIEQTEQFREDEFGSNEDGKIKLAGENVLYYENGFTARYLEQFPSRLSTFTGEYYPTINIIYPIVKNIIPSLYYKNPHILALPKRKLDEDTSPYVSALLNYFFNQLNIKLVNQNLIFDAYVLGMGVCKIGYSTKLGSDIKDKDMFRKREKSKMDKFKEMLGLKKPSEGEEEIPQNIDLNEFITAENPYVKWVNPFNFGIDPQARSIYEANYVFEKVRKNLAQVKSNSNYKNTSDLNGYDLEEVYEKDIPSTQIENFKPIDIYEIHYKTDEGINILVLAKDNGNIYKPLRHDKSIYEMDGFQYEVLTFNKHEHRLYPVSDVQISKGLQDRINTTFENILDQVDKFVSKIAVDETAISESGKLALSNGQIGAIVYTNKSPREVFQEVTLTQVKGDLLVMVEKLIDVVSLETGITKAMLTGLTTAETATEAQIGQAGQNLRLSDKADIVSDFSNRQARKLWQVVKQFVNIEEIELITGETAFDEVTGTPRYKWLNEINSNISEKIVKGEYDFQIEVGSTQKPELPVLRKQVENMVNILGQKGVMEMFQMQGYKIELAEIFRQYLMLFPDVFKNPGKIIKPIGPGAQGLVPPQQQQQQGGSGGSNLGVLPQQFQIQRPPVNPADIMSELGGEKGGMPPLA